MDVFWSGGKSGKAEFDTDRKIVFKEYAYDSEGNKSALAVRVDEEKASLLNGHYARQNSERALSLLTSTITGNGNGTGLIYFF